MLSSSSSSFSPGINSRVSRRSSKPSQLVIPSSVTRSATVAYSKGKQKHLQSLSYVINVGLLLAVLLVQCVQSYEFLYRAEHDTVCICNETVHARCPEDICTENAVFENSGAGKVLQYAQSPCFCEGFKVKECPSECKKNPSKKKNRSKKNKLEDEPDPCYICRKELRVPCPEECYDNYLPKARIDTRSFRHDDEHPDHIDTPVPDMDYLPMSNALRRHNSQGGHIERHRKVYLAQKIPEYATLAPIKMVIPMKIPEDTVHALPRAKPLYKYKKYVSYETKPEIQMVPVTKTIIRPADVSIDQIIDENGNQVPKDFDVRKL